MAGAGRDAVAGGRIVDGVQAGDARDATERFVGCIRNINAVDQLVKVGQ